ncbi:MAG: hypothetical protein XD85_0600 [Parcubacteria bacterium 34_609]|nr:MAG: hypothetical protein XD85_0600 [Parcubacteria bacterium 34_609]
MKLTAQSKDIILKEFKKVSELESTLKELTTAIELDDESGIFYSLKEFSVLGYIATGNGNYLYKKGMLKID